MHKIGSREKLSEFRVSSEYRVFCIGEYLNKHLWSQPEIQNLRWQLTELPIYFTKDSFNCAPQLPNQQKESSSITRYVRKNQYEFNIIFTLLNIKEGIPSAATLWGLCCGATLWMWVKGPCHSQPAKAKLAPGQGQGPGRAAVCPSLKSEKANGKIPIVQILSGKSAKMFPRTVFAIRHV